MSIPHPPAALETGANRVEAAGNGVMRGLLLDDERRPRVRDVLGYYLGCAASADFAVRRVRLAALDFRDEELGVRRCRVLLGSLDVDALAEAVAAGRGDAQRAGALDALRALIDEGRLEIRSAGTTRWSPDFALLDGIPPDGPMAARTLALIGSLGLGSDGGRAGPLLTSVLAGGPAIASLALRFERLWSDGWDVLEVIASALRRT